MRSLTLFVFLLLASVALPQQPRPLDPGEAQQLAALICRQLPNLTSFPDALEVESPPPGPARETKLNPPVFDDVYDTLLQLGPYSVSCLVDKMADTRWMPDPRMEPLLGAPKVGDVAYMILKSKGVPDFIPILAHRKPDSLRMDFWYEWPARGNNRSRLQSAVRTWIAKHPKCCGVIREDRVTHPTTPILFMSPGEIEEARLRIAQLRLGMLQKEVLRIAGKPDAMEQHQRVGEGGLGSEPGLVGFCAGDRNETGAFIYYIQRWNQSVSDRDPLRDRYVILYFSSAGKLTRIFSNVNAIAPRFPNGISEWERIAGMR